ncbi:hypothetical protein H112_03446 [Trichophyton rubrum D6]|nr:uncharacterized protein TERG_04773 [Trichophyton rubrum CBS 118892]EZF23970.1 hypothetical protein H100_03451 [Trichophyton rubrum MR850]EZF42976.1 hypothetical protein H102_03446 [Trichophyton rubrum CBS 100081]EZF53666.1 hypothetical protein H103_03455 [Trichophyton rubrum CBS 288.86]EZF64243.1 hypothetical protein H104_03440 [Trichophyton rubrum CBS 289.86]EZF85539.1 hypothetical protein H110_03452 [Trichophyton rubrum MR1448]EZF96363.1 hypothetical protein H113_03467 [Trichophyton rubr
MVSPFIIDSAAPIANLSPESAREPAKKKQKVVPGLEPEYFASQESFTSEYFPLEGPFGGKVPATVPLAAVIWRDYCDGTHLLLDNDKNKIKISMDSGEPGIQFKYKCLNAMIINFPKGLPENFADVFAELAAARVRYFATHEVYRKEKRALEESDAITQQLHMKQRDIHSNPGYYEPNAAENNSIALKECVAECEYQRGHFENRKNSLVSSAQLFMEAKEKAMPFVVRLQKFYADMKEAYSKAKEAEAKRLEQEKAEKERRQKAIAEKEKLAKQKRSRDRVVKERRQRTDAATKARLDHDARAWAEYLARSERMRNGANDAAKQHGGKQVNLQ